MKDIFASNLSSRKDINLDTIFSNPIYERLIGKKEKISELFGGNLDILFQELKSNLKLPYQVQ
jgi:hypothetical protein